MNLIKQIQLPNGRSTTNLGFGCAGILRLPTTRSREHLLRTAVDEGITHFDVARMYGLGAAEGIVGSALKPCRNQITLATKFGLPYTSQKGFALKFQSLARWVLSSNPRLKSKIKGLASKAAAPAQPAGGGKNYSVEEMEQSLTKSLEQLQTDWVDILFIHEPGTHDSIPENMNEALRQKKASRQIGAFGISAGRTELEYFLETRPDLCGDAIQCQNSIFREGAEGQHLKFPFSGTFGIMGEALPQLADFLENHDNVAEAWSDRWSIDLKNRENLGILILAIALIWNPEGLVLFSTSSSDRLRRIIRRLKNNSFSEESLLEFRQRVIQELHAN